MAFLDSVMVWISNWGIIVPILCLLLTKDKKIILRGIVSVVLAFFITDVLKLLIARPRPFPGSTGWLLNTPADTYSFPSKHASTSFALATSVSLHNNLLGWVSAVSALLISVSRVYLGAHFWSDVIAGAILGIVISYATDKLAIYFEKGKHKKRK